MKYLLIVAANLLMLSSLFITACNNLTQPIVMTSYAEVSIDEQIKLADVIVAGTITSISKTRWNQDSGEYWEEVVKDEIEETIHTALPYYTIEILVNKPILNAKSGEKLVATVIGMSPLEEQNRNSHRLQVNKEAVVFMRHSEMAWRDGTRPILQLMSTPEKSAFFRGENDLYETAHVDEVAVPLDALITRIAQKRPEDIQR
ncbi:MAG: hypothetical protein GWN00_25880 [Aliifodinibius sp.]|nr:hypothetical protein [Fodinibius sp.]NIX00438.1 hypothetical protein [Phycisphaerae bacterium]NIY28105.1 hypothetical protein [Fodinibius sp.]